MPEVIVTTRSGEQRTMKATSGFTLMETICDDGVSELLALCGGVCACATCHVYVDRESEKLLPPIGQDEDDLLESSSHRQPSSRLSCQIRLTDEMDGLRVTIAPAD